MTFALCQGTGASFLVTAVYFTFLFSCALLILTTAHFVIGAAVEKVDFKRTIIKELNDVAHDIIIMIIRVLQCRWCAKA